MEFWAEILQRNREKYSGPKEKISHELEVGLIYYDFSSAENRKIREK